MLAILALSVPYFGLAVLVVVIPSIYFKWTPVWTYVPFSVDPVENLKIMLVPAFVFGVTRAGPVMRIMRSALLDVLRQDYIRTAWSKGLAERPIVLRHALKNALIPVVSLVGLQMPLYIGGSVIIESIFRLPGVGLFMMPTIIVVATTGLSTVILTEASLSFLGLGVPPPYPTWGGMLSLAGLDHMYRAPWLAIWPAVALSLAVFGFNMLGDALRDLLDPRLKGG